MSTLIGHMTGVAALKQIACGSLASASLDHTIRLWNVRRTNECKHTLHGHSAGELSLKLVAPATLASGSEDNRIKVWNFTTVRCERTLAPSARYSSTHLVAW